MDQQELINLLQQLVKHPQEEECLEFKLNFHSAKEIGEQISAIANSACIHDQECGYLVFGVEDGTHSVRGTTFKAKTYKEEREELVNWLTNRLSPRIDFRIYEFDYSPNNHVSLFMIPAAKNRPINFSKVAYVRVGSSKRLLSDFPEKESKIWQKNVIPFEKLIAKDNLNASDVISLLSTETYFDLMKIPHPSSQLSVIEKLIDEGLVVRNNAYSITNLGALLFAKNLRNFEIVDRKTARVIIYKSTNKIETEREHMEARGYALAFENLVDLINSQLPANEEIGKVLREEKRMYPEIAIRELVANALIHQDFSEKGFPVIEIYSDRINISNSGAPLIGPDRFIDTYQARNEKLADLMRRLGFCEEKGSGVDKVIAYNELYQLPPINVAVSGNRTHVSMYAYKNLKDLNKLERISACYQHACLKQVSNQKMTNKSLRERFKISHVPTASKLIKEALEAKKIKEDDPDNKSKKYASYVPIWA